jgi:hypothetical protein
VAEGNAQVTVVLFGEVQAAHAVVRITEPASKKAS